MTLTRNWWGCFTFVSIIEEEILKTKCKLYCFIKTASFKCWDFAREQKSTNFVNFDKKLWKSTLRVPVGRSGWMLFCWENKSSTYSQRNCTQKDYWLNLVNSYVIKQGIRCRHTATRSCLIDQFDLIWLSLFGPFNFKLN